MTEVVSWIYLWFAFFLLVPCFDIFVSFLIFFAGGRGWRCQGWYATPGATPASICLATHYPPTTPDTRSTHPRGLGNKGWLKKPQVSIVLSPGLLGLFIYLHITILHQHQIDIICYIIKNKYMRCSDLWKLNFSAPIVNWSEILVSDWRRAN